MWCPNCQADVAAEVSAENQRVRCATCSTEIQTGTPVRTGAKTEAARELLQRWANDDLFDPFGPLPGVATKSADTTATDKSAAATTEPIVKSPHVDQPQPEANPDPAGSRPIYRFEAAHTARDEPSAERTAIPESESRGAQSEPEPVASAVRPIHRPHVSTSQAPRIAAPSILPDAASEDVHAAIQEDQARSTNWSSFWGQILAYLGVGGLTVGTSMVLWGYFGGPADYTPTGWLIVTVGQMLLFLGVITLVSGGLEQTTEEVARRIDRLGTQLIRIEQATATLNLRPPHTPAQQHGDKQSQSPESTSRETHTV